MTEKLLLCPFCGGTHIDFFTTEDGHDNVESAYVQCFTCDARNADQPSVADAIKNWNTRPAHAPTSGGSTTSVSEKDAAEYGLREDVSAAASQVAEWAKEPSSAYDAAMTTRRRRGQMAGNILEIAGEEIMTAHLALKCADAIDQNAAAPPVRSAATTVEPVAGPMRMDLALEKIDVENAQNSEIFNDMRAQIWAAGADHEDADLITRMLTRKGLYLFQTEPWKRCPSTHCERRAECSGPRDCTIKVPAPVPSTASSAEPVAWQWLTHDTWHTIDKTTATDPEGYARSFGFPVRPVFATPPSSGNADAVRGQIAQIIKHHCSVRVHGEDYAARDGLEIAADAILAALFVAPVSGQPEDTKLLDALKDESWDLRCFDMPTGGGDADIGWRVIGHWQAVPCERIVGEAFHDDPRAAIRDALSRKDENTGGPRS